MGRRDVRLRAERVDDVRCVECVDRPVFRRQQRRRPLRPAKPPSRSFYEVVVGFAVVLELVERVRVEIQYRYQAPNTALRLPFPSKSDAKRAAELPFRHDP